MNQCDCRANQDDRTEQALDDLWMMMARWRESLRGHLVLTYMDKFLYCYNCRIGQLMKRIAKFPSGTEYYECKNCEHSREYTPVPELEDDNDR